MADVHFDSTQQLAREYDATGLLLRWDFDEGRLLPLACSLGGQGEVLWLLGADFQLSWL